MAEIVTVGDVRAAGFCSKGLRAFAKDIGVDWASFVQNGIHIDDLAHIDDVRVMQMVEYIKNKKD